MILIYLQAKFVRILGKYIYLHYGNFSILYFHQNAEIILDTQVNAIRFLFKNVYYICYFIHFMYTYA